MHLAIWTLAFIWYLDFGICHSVGNLSLDPFPLLAFFQPSLGPLLGKEWSMELNQECTLLQNELRKFAQQVILEKADEFDKACTLPLENIKQLADMGILGAIIPEDMGGAALDLIGFVVALEEISKVCISTALTIATHNAFFAYPILKYGNENLKQKYLPDSATGRIIGGFSCADSDEVHAERQGEQYSLNGKAPFVLNCEANGPFTTFIKGQENVITLVVDKDAPGIKRSKNNNIIGLKAAGIGEITFENCVVQSDTTLGKENEGVSIMQTTNDFARVCLSAIALGLSQGATDEAIKYAKERIQFNQSIINFGMVREKIAEMTTKIEAARLLTYNAAMQYDAGKNYSKAAATAKYFAGQAAVEIATEALQIFGGYGYMKDYPVERYFRDAQVINVLCSTPAEEKENIVKETIG